MRVYHMNKPQGFGPSPDLVCFPVPPARNSGCMFPFGSWAKPVHLEYMLKKHEKALAFQVLRQSSAVSNFLKNNRFQATNGLIIATGTATHQGWPNRGGDYPEFLESANILYLQGGNRDDGKIDVTTVTGNNRRDNKFKIIESALKEFVQFIKNGQFGCSGQDVGTPQVGIYTL